jgi:hypothetical protein
MRYGLLEHLGCHLSSEGIAMSPAKIQPIEDWAEPRSVENAQQFSSFANLYREVAGKRYSQSRIGLRWEASRTFCSSWASPRSVKIV